ncbi:MAG: hypothetical protein HYV09_01110 [Deltaproteobacteria bacterium]|nr:hypothetical protein [Deltaproteobacteria bacterium]
MTRASLVLLAVVLAALSTGCMGVYAEANATVYPSLKYSESDTATPPKPLQQDGGGYALGFSLGFDFDVRRSTRVALGFTGHSTSLPGDGSVRGSQGELRLDFKVAKTGKSSQLRIGSGLSYGTATITMKSEGGEVTDKRSHGQVFAGPVFSQYVGKYQELSVMGAGSYLFAGAPGGSIGGVGLGARVTYSLHLGDTRPSSTAYTPLESGNNILDLIDAGAKRLGCDSKYLERQGDPAGGGSGLTATAVLARCPPDDEEIFFLQTVDGVAVECPHLDDDECRELTERIVDSASRVLRERQPAPPPVAPAPPPPVGPPPTMPAPSKPGGFVPKTTGVMPAAQPPPAS